MSSAARHQASSPAATMHSPISPSTLCPAPPHEPQHGGSRGSRRHSTGSNSGITYAKTWAEDVQKYHAAKAVLPWLPEQQKPVKHVTRYEKSREEREYDIVLGRFRDAEKELGCQQDESSKLKHTLEKGRAKQLRNIQRFHMINHAPLYPGAKDPTDKQPVQHPYRKKSAAEYNIVTNISHSGIRKDGPAAPVSGSPSLKPFREFNILTNKYHDRHDARFQQEAAQAKRVAAQKYWKTHAFDPVRITYVDEEREKTFLAQRLNEQKIHGKDRVLLLPPREQFSEGRLYNILNQRVINPSKLTAMTEKDQRALNKIQKATFEKKMRVLGEREQARATDLCLNRFAHERHTESYAHGYNVLSNQPYVGRDAEPMIPTRTHAALTAWQAIESGLPSGSKIAPAVNLPDAVSPRSSSGLLQSSMRSPTSSPPARPQSRGDSTTRKPNILIVDQPSGIQESLKAPPTSSSLSSSSSTKPTVRTGGFSG